MTDEAKHPAGEANYAITISAFEDFVERTGECAACPFYEEECNGENRCLMRDTLALLRCGHSNDNSARFFRHELEQTKQERDGLNILLGQAQSMLETRTRERDAAIADINMVCQCDVCTRICKYDKPNPYCECADFEWRGVQEEHK